jgi:hypothetical protein
VSGEILAARLVGAEHPRGGIAHLVILAAIVVIALLVLGVNWLRRRRASARKK